MVTLEKPGDLKGPEVLTETDIAGSHLLDWYLACISFPGIRTAKPKPVEPE